MNLPPLKQDILNVNFYINAAEKHGIDSHPDHEVGDLQDFLRAAWAVMSPEQRKEFARRPEVASTLESSLNEDELEQFQEKVEALQGL